MTTVNCPNCNSSLRLGDLGKKYAGRTLDLSCRLCSHTFTVRFGKPQQNANHTKVSEGNKIENVLQERSKAILILKREGHTQMFQLTEGTHQIGRLQIGGAEINSSLPEDTFISRQHGLIIVSRNKNGGYEYVYSDEASSNGSFLNKDTEKEVFLNDPADSVYLNDGDCISIGSTQLIFKDAQKESKSKFGGL